MCIALFIKNLNNTTPINVSPGQPALSWLQPLQHILETDCRGFDPVDVG